MVGLLFPCEVKTFGGEIERLSGPVYPAEESFVRDALPKRRQEFLAGRICARRALAQLGASPAPLPVNTDRTPAWPRNFIGSISHTDRYCYAAVARADSFAGIGVDVEMIDHFNKEFLIMVCTPRELERFSRLSEEEKRRRGALIFSAKECFYKCQYSVTKSWLGFLDVEVEINAADCRFNVVLLNSPAPSLQSSESFRGKYLIEDNLVLTGMVLRGHAAAPGQPGPAV